MLVAIAMIAACSVRRLPETIGGNQKSQGVNAAQSSASKSDDQKMKGETPDVAPPVVQIEPGDMTSMIGDTPLRVTVYSGPGPIGKILLEPIANQLRLVETSCGKVVAFATKIRPSDGFAYSEQGYPSSVPGVIEVTPSSSLAAENWYELQVLSLPTGVVPGKRGMHKLEGGGVSARFSRGSHPTPSTVRRCEKSDGVVTMYVDFSEKVSLGDDAKSKVQLENELIPGACEMDARAHSVARSVHFKCQAGSGKGGKFRISVAPTLGSPSGGMLATIGGARGGNSFLVEDAVWERYDNGCSKVDLQ